MTISSFDYRFILLGILTGAALIPIGYLLRRNNNSNSSNDSTTSNEKSIRTNRRMRRRNRQVTLPNDTDQDQQDLDHFTNFFEVEPDETGPFSEPIQFESLQELAYSPEVPSNIDQENLSSDINQANYIRNKLLSSISQLPISNESQTVMELLYSIAEENAIREGFVHRSITCNHCGSSPIRGLRFKCSNCLDYDLCEGCEGLQVHLKQHVFLKIRIPIPPLSNPRNISVVSFYPGYDFNVSGFEMNDLEFKTNFDFVELDALYVQFKSLSTHISPLGGITRDVYNKCLGPVSNYNNLIIERMFCFFDQDKDGVISFHEFAFGISVLTKGSLDTRIKYAFQGYDLNNDGFITRDELYQMFRAYFQLSTELVRDVVKTMEEGIHESFDDESAKPVSSAFQGPIYETSPTEESKQIKKNPLSTAKTSRNMKRLIIFSPTEQSQNSQFISPTDQSQNSSPTLTEFDFTGNRTVSLSSYAPLREIEESLKSPKSPQHLLSDKQETFPLIETLSQEAIKELVDRTFNLANNPERLDFELFCWVCEKDTNLIAWFEALGSVF